MDAAASCERWVDYRRVRPSRRRSAKWQPWPTSWRSSTRAKMAALARSCSRCASSSSASVRSAPGDSCGRCRVRTGDRVRQCREPVPRPCDVAAPRNRTAAGDRSHSWTRRSPVAGRVAHSRGARARWRRRARVDAVEPGWSRSHQRDPSARGDGSRRHGAGLHPRSVDCDGDCLRPGPGVARVGRSRGHLISNEASTRGTAGRRSGRLRDLLVAAQIATALVLLVGAGLLLRSFTALTRVDTGIDTRNLVTFDMALSGARAARHENRVAFYDEMLAAIASAPRRAFGRRRCDAADRRRRLRDAICRRGRTGTGCGARDLSRLSGRYARLFRDDGHSHPVRARRARF